MNALDEEVSLALYQEGFQVSIIAATLEVPWREVWRLVRGVPRIKLQFDSREAQDLGTGNPIMGVIRPDPGPPIRSRVHVRPDAQRTTQGLRLLAELLVEGT